MFKLDLTTKGCQTRKRFDKVQNSILTKVDDLLGCDCINSGFALDSSNSASPQKPSIEIDEEDERPLFVTASQYDPNPVSRIIRAQMYS